jgi:cell wall integrity and stress response component
VVTAASQTSANGNTSNKPNTAGIAAGVVVGIVGLGAIIGAAIFFYRRHKRRAVEEEYRRNAEINSFVQKKPMSGSSDSRWDGNHMAERRQSNGSIADDEDFSRRILQVGI